MLEWIFGVVLLLWLVGVVTAHTFGGLVHILLLLAIGMLLVRFYQTSSLAR